MSKKKIKHRDYAVLLVTLSLGLGVESMTKTQASCSVGFPPAGQVRDPGGEHADTTTNHSPIKSSGYVSYCRCTHGLTLGVASAPVFRGFMTIVDRRPPWPPRKTTNHS